MRLGMLGRGSAGRPPLKVGTNTSGGGDIDDFNIPTTQAECDYFADRRARIVRINFRWERVQPTVNAALNTTNRDKLTAMVDFALNRGLIPYINAMQYGGRYIPGNATGDITAAATAYKLGDGTLATDYSDFADFWDRISNLFTGAGYEGVIFGLSNEPESIPINGNGDETSAWVAAANEAISAIRGNGANHLITIEGNGWNNAKVFATMDMTGSSSTGTWQQWERWYVGASYAAATKRGTISRVTDPATTTPDFELYYEDPWTELAGGETVTGETSGASCTAGTPTEPWYGNQSGKTFHNDIVDSANNWIAEVHNYPDAGHGSEGTALSATILRDQMRNVIENYCKRYGRKVMVGEWASLDVAGDDTDCATDFVQYCKTEERAHIHSLIWWESRNNAETASAYNIPHDTTEDARLAWMDMEEQ